jgi:hypothetical protein
MKRMHVHVAVDNLDKAIGFYSTLFAATPTVVKSDYAKWMLDDPRVNFAISTRGGAVGVDHLGIQAESAEELAELRARAAALSPREQGEVSCCYARSDKHWITDPQGIAWEQFQTLADIPVFGITAGGKTVESNNKACCTPAQGSNQAACC